MAFRLLFSIIAALVWSCFAAVAAGLPLSNVEYSAERVIDSGQGNFSQKIHVAKLKERAETQMQGMKMVSIFRFDKKVYWMVMPDHQMYQEIDLAKAAKQRDASTITQDPTVEVSVIGPDTVEGHAATKYQMSTQDKTTQGFVWLTKENIPVRMDMITVTPKGQKQQTKIMLKNLKLGAQPAALFEVPGGYMKMPAMGGMGGMGGSMPMPGPR